MCSVHLTVPGSVVPVAVGNGVTPSLLAAPERDGLHLKMQLLNALQWTQETISQLVADGLFPAFRCYPVCFTWFDRSETDGWIHDVREMLE